LSLPNGLLTDRHVFRVAVGVGSIFVNLGRITSFA